MPVSCFDTSSFGDLSEIMLHAADSSRGIQVVFQEQESQLLPGNYLYSLRFKFCLKLGSSLDGLLGENRFSDTGVPSATAATGCSLSMKHKNSLDRDCFLLLASFWLASSNILAFTSAVGQKKLTCRPVQRPYYGKHGENEGLAVWLAVWTVWHLQPYGLYGAHSNPGVRTAQPSDNFLIFEEHVHQSSLSKPVHCSP